jgi:hypothetical protein
MMMMMMMMMMMISIHYLCIMVIIFCLHVSERITKLMCLQGKARHKWTYDATRRMTSKQKNGTWLNHWNDPWRDFHQNWWWSPIEQQHHSCWRVVFFFIDNSVVIQWLIFTVWGLEDSFVRSLLHCVIDFWFCFVAIRDSGSHVAPISATSTFFYHGRKWHRTM